VIGWQQAFGQPDTPVGVVEDQPLGAVGSYHGIEPPMAATAENRVLYGRSPLPIPKNPAAFRSCCQSGDQAPTIASQSRP
jgi:hypothetical protein